MRQVPVLVSAALFKPEQIARLSVARFRVLLDSGAFSNFQTGKDVVTLDGYCDLLKQMPNVWRYFNLDVVGDPAATQRNYNILRERGFKPSPVIQPGTTPEELSEIVTEGLFVGVSGIAIAGARSKETMDYVTRMVHAVQRRGGLPHLLGCGHFPSLLKIRPYSADSTASGNAGRYGLVSLWDVKKHTFVSHRRQWPLSARFAALAATYGITAKQLASPGWWSTAKANAGDNFLIPMFRSYLRFSMTMETLGMLYFQSIFPTGFSAFMEAARLEAEEAT